MTGQARTSPAGQINPPAQADCEKFQQAVDQWVRAKRTEPCLCHSGSLEAYTLIAICGRKIADKLLAGQAVDVQIMRQDLLGDGTLNAVNNGLFFTAGAEVCSLLDSSAAHA